MKFDDQNPQAAEHDHCYLCELETTLTPREYAKALSEGEIHYG